ncbi:MAG TPA: methylmalonyl-CoA mutase family protein, partial [Bacillota bacterium]|nr:methylmalonyl-CoA mutase family protein [Bacillota bacterium]
GYESGVTETVDPLAGSYYIESLTDQIEKKATEYISSIDGLGGAAKAIDKGYIQKEIQDSAYKYQKEIEAGDRIVVGVNKFQIEEKAPKGLLKVDPLVGELQKKKIAELRKERDNGKVNKTLEALRKAAQGNVNLMPLILDAVKAYATLGEICGVLREVFGEYQQSIVL